MEESILAYNDDIESSNAFLQSKKKFKIVYALNKKNLLNFSSTIKDGSLSQILFVVSINFYLANQEFFCQLAEKKYNSTYFIVFKKNDYKKIQKIKLKTSFTLIPNEDLYNFFQKISTPITSNLKNTLSSKKNDYSKKILEIAISLGSERNIEVLMNNILTACMEIANADAGSLAVLGFDKQLYETNKDILTFYASKNISKEIHFNRFSMKIDLNSLAGYSIIKKEILNIPDAYKIPKKKQYHFNNSFDKQTGFKTKSILVIPIIDSKENAIGVIQLLNKKKGDHNQIIDYENFDSQKICVFNYTDQQTVVGVTNLASMLLKNQLLYNQVNNLLENFVKASVYAVEQRDPATSGHSERVANYSVELAKKTNTSKGVLEDYYFNTQQIKELRHAALLHDFGKIAVREKTLVKANKLEDFELENILKKIRIYLLNYQLAIEQKKTILLNDKKLSLNEVSKRIKKLEKQTVEEVERMDYYRQVIVESNVPRVIEEKASQILKKIQKIKFFDNGLQHSILSDEEFQFLNIKKGSLSPKERKEIESHVTQSFYFLKRINWISELKNVPEIAYGHHEKLDGSGYPRQLSAHQILPQSKIMTICDIYDALTASDRPYKKSLSPEKSIEILYDEANQNKIDSNLLDLFVKKKLYLLKSTPES